MKGTHLNSDQHASSVQRFEDLAARFLTHPAAREDRNLARVDSPLMLINGRFVSADNGATFDTFNPADASLLAGVPLAGQRDIDNAVKAARAALPAWSATPGSERGKLVFRLARRLAERARSFAVLETLDGGKPIRESRDVDVPLASQHLFSHAGWADKLEYLGMGPSPRPHGVVAQIIPWNFPLLMCAWKIGPALAAGNTVVLKPAETTPLTALELGRLCVEVGFPPGVVNIVSGDGSTGALLAAHPGIDKLAFTGSTDVGRIIARQAQSRGIPVTLELGGKSANIVYRDADIDAAVEGIVDAIFFNQGHVCCAGSRLLVEESVHDRLVERLTRRISLLRVGDPLDKNTDIGAINSPEQLSRISGMVDAAIARGATRLAVDIEVPSQGCFYAPTVLLGVDPADAVARQEIFGPVLSVLTFRTPDEAVEIANDTPYGLAAGVWSQRPERLHWTAQRLAAGVIWANTYNRFDPTAAFGGFRESGFGREGGRSGMEAYCVN